MAAKIKKPTTAQQTRNTSQSATVAPKANNITASTATKNVTQNTSASKANNVTAATAIKNTSASTPTKAITTSSTPKNTSPASNVSVNTSPVYSGTSSTVSDTKYNPGPATTANNSGSYAMTHEGIVTPTTSTGTDAFPSLSDALLGTAGAIGGAAGVNVNALAQAIDPNSTPASKTDYWNGVLTNLLDTSDLLTGSNTMAARNLIRNNNVPTAENEYEEEENLGKYNRISGMVDQALPPYSSPNYSTLADTLVKNTSPSGNSGVLPGKGNTSELNGSDLALDLVNDIVNKTSGGTSGGGGSRGGSGSASGVGGLGGYDLDSLYDLINQQLAEYDNGYNTLMQNLLDAYNSNFGSLNDSYLAALNALGLNYADTENLLNGRLANSQQALEDARRRAMQEAYIARMMDQKNLEDYLGAAGFSGGATESVLSGILNNYRNNRNKIEENTQTSLRELLQSYLDNMSNARQRYNEGLLSAENNRMSAAQNLANGLYESQANAASNYANQRANVYDNLYNTLANLALKG